MTLSRLFAALMLLLVGMTAQATLAAPTTASAPTVMGLSATSAVAGATSDLTLTVNGTNFTSASVVYFGDRALATTFVNATTLTATVPASALTHPRTVEVFVYNGRRNGGSSNALPFTITPANAPTLISLSATSAVAGSGPLTLTVTGTNFISTSVVYFGREALATIFVNATTLTATVPAGALAYPGQVPVVVSNGVSNGSSKALTFTITPPTTQVFYLIGRRGAANAGLYVTYQVSASAALDLTQSVTLTVATTSATVYSSGAITLTPTTYPERNGTSVTIYRYRSATEAIDVVPQANNQYAVEFETTGVDLSSIDRTQPVTVTLTIGGQTFSAQTQPVTTRG
ncbi:MAG: IPT/TIG domain-containing protein [Armatimonadetes bacterium]|nr:IPT/TIG domain-containing protein [Armatimonadota bacterium]